MSSQECQTPTGQIDTPYSRLVSDIQVLIDEVDALQRGVIIRVQMMLHNFRKQSDSPDRRPLAFSPRTIEDLCEVMRFFDYPDDLAVRRIFVAVLCALLEVRGTPGISPRNIARRTGFQEGEVREELNNLIQYFLFSNQWHISINPEDRYGIVEL